MAASTGGEAPNTRAGFAGGLIMMAVMTGSAALSGRAPVAIADAVAGLVPTVLLTLLMIRTNRRMRGHGANSLASALERASWLAFVPAAEGTSHARCIDSSSWQRRIRRVRSFDHRRRETTCLVR